MSGQPIHSRVMYWWGRRCSTWAWGGFWPNFSRFWALIPMERYMNQRSLVIKEVFGRNTLATYTMVVDLQLCQRWYCFFPKMVLCLGKNRCFPLWFHASHLRIDGFLRSMIEWVGDCWRRGMGRRHFSQRQFGLFCEAEWCCGLPPHYYSIQLQRLPWW